MLVLILALVGAISTRAIVARVETFRCAVAASGHARLLPIPLGRSGIDPAKDSILLAVRTTCKEEGIQRQVLYRAAIAECDAPETVDHEDLAVGRSQLSEKCTACGIEGVDRAVAEIANQKAIAEVSEIRRRDRHAPRRVECAACRDPLQQMPVGIERVDDS